MKEYTKFLIEWTRNYFNDNKIKYAVIGLSGGKDSTISATILKEALGSNRVIGVQMPNGIQKDIDDSTRVMDFLELPEENRFLVDIKNAYDALLKSTFKDTDNLNFVITTNLPARLRMATLYNIAAYVGNARVICTSNASEVYVGYMTKWGDVGDVGLLRNLTVSEVLKIGDDLNIPFDLVHKAPSDGMSGKTDEDNLGFTYKNLDSLILHGEKNVSSFDYEKINHKHNINKHKNSPMPCPELPENLKEELLKGL